MHKSKPAIHLSGCQKCTQGVHNVPILEFSENG